MRKGEPLLHFRQAFVFDMAQTEVTPRRLIPEEEVYRQVFDAEVRIFLVNPSLIFCYHWSSTCIRAQPLSYMLFSWIISLCKRMMVKRYFTIQCIAGFKSTERKGKLACFHSRWLRCSSTLQHVHVLVKMICDTILAVLGSVVVYSP